MSRKIIITGVAGFLGSHLLTELLKEGNSVIGIDNMSTGKQENIEQHMNNKCFTFLCEDVSNPQIVNKAIFEKIDEIYHMASPASPVFYQENPFDTIYVNTIGTKNMLSIAKKIMQSFFLQVQVKCMGIQRFILNQNPIVEM